MKTRQEGFSLIEIMVTILIVACIAILLMPLFKKAYSSAHLAKCMGNQRLLYAGWAQYAQERNGQMLPAANGSGDWDGILSLANIIPFGRRSPSTRTAYQCPVNQGRIGPAWERGNYGYNAFLGNYHNLTDGKNNLVYDASGKTIPILDPRYIAAVSQPHRTVILTDAEIWGDYGASANTSSGPRWYIHPQLADGILRGVPLTSTSRRTGYHHDGKANFLFVDGHVETLTAEETQRRHTDKTIITDPWTP